MPALYLAEDVPCKVCGKGVLNIGTRPVATAEEAKAWGEREFQRRRGDLPLAFEGAHVLGGVLHGPAVMASARGEVPAGACATTPLVEAQGARWPPLCPEDIALAIIQVLGVGHGAAAGEPAPIDGQGWRLSCRLM